MSWSLRYAARSRMRPAATFPGLRTILTGGPGPAQAASAARRTTPGRARPRAAALGLVAVAALGGGSGSAQTPAGMAAWRTLLGHQVEQAHREARAVLAEQPGDPIAAYVLARTADLLHEAPAADSLLHALERTHPGAALVGLAQLRLSAREPDSAASLLAAARDHLGAAGDRAGESFALGLLAWVHVGQARLDRAIPMFEEALAVARESASPELEAWLRLRLGLALFSSRRHAEAAEHYEIAVALAHDLGIPEWEAEGHINLSVVARWNMDLESALSHRRAALEGYRASGNVAGQARALHYIAAIHMMRGELPQAMRLLYEAITTADRAGEHREGATSRGDLATLNLLLGNFELALQQYDEALRSYQPGTQFDYSDRQYAAWAAGMLGNVALVLTEMGRLREAGDYQTRALEAIRRTGTRRDEAEIVANLGRYRCLAGDPEQGREYLQAAIDSARVWSAPLTEATALADLGACHLLDGDLGAAEAAYAAAEEVAARTGYFRLQGDVLAGRARVARSRGDPAAALELLERAMTLAEGVRARSRGAEQIQARAHARSEGIYADAVDLIYELSLGRPAEGRRAFELIQRAKARSLLDLLTEAEIGLRCRADPRYVEREEAILDSIATLLSAAGEVDMAIARLEDELSGLESELREADPRYAAVRYPQPETLEHLQSVVLGPGELLLEYLLGENASYVCAVTRESFRLVQLPARARIEAEIAELLPLLQDYNLSGGLPDYLMPALTAVSESLLGPVREECRRAARLIVAPHGAAHYVPFEVLSLQDPVAGDTQRPGAGCAELPYLVKSTDVVYVHAAGELSQRRSPAAAGPPRRMERLLVVGAPPADETPGAFFGTRAPRAPGGGSALPGAQAELSMLREVFGQAEIVALEGRNATEDGLREAAAGGVFDCVHIAAHGLYNERRPRYSGLVLGAGAEGRGDGFLTAGEVFGIELPCRQVVLSACSSALGEHVTGEGFYGLTRAFHYAGAQSVIAALWDVPDEATALLMRAFYDQFARTGGADGAHALAEAKRLRLREAAQGASPGADRPSAGAGAAAAGRDSGDAAGSGTPLDLGHPCFWAAFVASGIPR